MRQISKFFVPTLAASALLTACGGSSSSSSSKSASPPGDSGASAVVVKVASNSTLGGTVLVDSQGMTLYRLSGEQHGKWICTSGACAGIWHPLTAGSGSAPSGTVGSLGTVKRPDGTMQVTYNEMPLYTFAQDQKPGDARGQGIKDVGTWTAITTGAAVSTPPATSTPAPAPAPSSGGGGYGY